MIGPKCFLYVGMRIALIHHTDWVVYNRFSLEKQNTFMKSPNRCDPKRKPQDTRVSLTPALSPGDMYLSLPTRPSALRA